MRQDEPGDRASGARGRKQYLPSEQVLKELASLGPDLGKLAQELGQRLSEARTDARP